MYIQPNKIILCYFSPNNPQVKKYDNSSQRPLHRRIARNVRIARTNAGLTMQQLAERSGIHKQTISFVESARNDFNMRTIFALSKGLNYPIHRLVSRTFEKDLIQRYGAGKYIYFLD